MNKSTLKHSQCFQCREQNQPTMCQCINRNNAYENSNAKIAVIILQSTCKMQSKHAKRAKEGRVLASVPIVSQTKDKQPSCPYSPLLPFCDFLFCSPCSHHSANSCRTASRLSLISLFSLHLMSHLWLVLQAMLLELQHLVKKLLHSISSFHGCLC